MKSNAGNEQVAFIAASLVALSDMSETELRELLNIVGIETIRELLTMDALRYELSYQKMAEEICAFIGWEPTLHASRFDACILDKLGNQITSIIEQAGTLFTQQITKEELLYVMLRLEVLDEYLGEIV